jgi:coenzyme F420 biosynthesis associated uncharacterized protein
MTEMVDWDLAASTAARLAGGGPAISPEQASAAVDQLRRLSGEAEQHVSDFTHLDASGLHPPVRVVDRAAWSAANVAGFRILLEPVADKLLAGRGLGPGPIATAVGSRITAVQIGSVLAFLAGKVLGQYEVFSGDPGQLLLVAPNIVQAERTLAVDPHDFRLWVCLHEVTHRTQFAAVPWLRGHFMAEVQAFIDASDPDAMKERLSAAVSEVARAIRDRDGSVSVLDIVQTPAQKAVLDRLTALMTLVEGHAEHVMNGVGPQVVPSVEVIKARFAQRRQGTNVVDKAIRRLLGIDVKMRQYAEGSAFVTAVVDAVGMDGFNRIWTSPQTLPTLAEIADHTRWVARVHGEPALPAG